MQPMLKASTQHALNLEQPLSQIKGVGPHAMRCLAKLNLKTYRDALFHFPLRYEDRTRLTPIQHVRPQHKALIQGEVIKVQVHRGRKRWCDIQVEDKTGVIHLVLFHFSSKQLEVLEKCPTVRCYGECKTTRGAMSMVHPEMQFVSPNTPVEGSLTPIYPTTKGLLQTVLRKVMNTVLDEFNQVMMGEALPQSWVSHYQLISVQEAFEQIHRPQPHMNLSDLENRTSSGFKRLILEEVLTHQVSLRQQREASQQLSSPPLPCPALLIDQFKQQLPFELTSAQLRAIEAINQDLSKSKPMMRLVQGDVGSGKTVVAAIACLYALAQQSQVAVLAPTEILAKQHYEQFKLWLVALGYEVVFLKGSLKAKQKKLVLERCQQPGPLVVVGTHALFQQSVEFENLSLMIIDEQHRFGVAQRLQLQAKARLTPHQLVMTATPIPRTLAMTRYRDLDLTLIDELPPGRKEITTLCINQDARAEVITKIRDVIEKGQQIYWVCPLIEESEKLQIQAAEMTYEQIKSALDYPLDLVHGKLKADEKESIMSGFIEGDTKILVATTVIEVGVNVPNATLMVIENAERLGLAQLHQLRGRVGRGDQQSYCLLLYKSPLSQHAKKRLEVMRKTNDGFIIAEEDLKLRGPGEVLGVRQTGVQIFRVADLFRDQAIILEMDAYLDANPKQIELLYQNLKQLWTGDDANYTQV